MGIYVPTFFTQELREKGIGAVLASLLFDYTDTFRIMFETKVPIPSQFVQMLPCF